MKCVFCGIKFKSGEYVIPVGRFLESRRGSAVATGENLHAHVGCISNVQRN